MSKELIVSANRHETRVALLEDDQVVEVYHQRENEYSLAGSIHKGRVTRVLPGMQSAFVDIGLERDAFLYVSDFFEDSEEYDEIVSTVEENVLKLDKAPPVAPVAPVTPAPATEPAAEAPVAVAPEPAAEVAAPPAQAPTQGNAARRPDDRADARDRDRRGRRSRRRRPKGRGLPESKFFTPRHESPAAPPESEAPPAAPVEEPRDIVVLPGESLAKYSQAEPPDSAAALVDWDEPELEDAPAEAPAEPEVEPVAEAAPVEAPPEAPAEPAEPELAAAVEEVAQEEAAMEEAAIEDSGEEAGFEEGDAAENAVESAAEEEGSPESSEEPSGPEPARIPTSLTATLREQGPRYLHRLSRRMRRRQRMEGPNPSARSESAPPARERQAAAPEPRPEARTVTRPEPARPEKAAGPSISDLLREGQEIIVQIAKEPLGQKGARITSHIALPGRFLVYMPTVDHIGVSRKIPSDEERLRLKRILLAHHTGIPGGFIVRTAGDGRSEEELRADMMFLYNLWLDLRQKAEKKPAPALVHHDLDVVERILRDQLTASFKSVWVDNEEVYENVLRFVQRFQPALVNRVKLYTRAVPIFDEFGITQELEKALRPKVWLKTGGYIVINQTEALVAIDVNTGKFVGRSNRLEDTIVKTNTDAIKEIVRQIRLRDLGGIIVVDFIDMDERKNRQRVMQALEEAMRADRAPYKILQFNDFGLVAITRKRVKQSLERTLCIHCPYCEGSGYVKSVQTVVGEILQEAHKIARAIEGTDVTLRVNPEVAKFLKSNRNSYLQELEEILGRTVLVKTDGLLHQEKFDLA
jgi:ribonuclease G